MLDHTCRLQNNKDYFDQSLDEIKLLKYINEADPNDEHGMLRLFDYFYYKASLTRSWTRKLCNASCLQRIHSQCKQH